MTSTSPTSSSEQPRGPVALLSVSIDLGAGRRGVDMGPSAVRLAGVVEAIHALDRKVVELGTVNAAAPETVSSGGTSARYLQEIQQICQDARDLLLEGLEQGAMPLILGGDHSISIGTVAALSDYHHRRDEKVGLIWVDAHTDMNTPEISPSGNIHGMSLAVLTGHGPLELTGLTARTPAISAEHASVLGAREIDPSERELVRESGIRVFTMSEVDERGIAACMDEAVERAMTGTAGFHLSFDLDAIDPMVAPGVGTPVPGGLSYREGHLICEKAARSGGLRSLEVVELNPVLDLGNRTAQLAVGLVASGLGKTIL